MIIKKNNLFQIETSTGEQQCFIRLDFAAPSVQLTSMVIGNEENKYKNYRFAEIFLRWQRRILQFLLSHKFINKSFIRTRVMYMFVVCQQIGKDAL